MRSYCAAWSNASRASAISAARRHCCAARARSPSGAAAVRCLASSATIPGSSPCSACRARQAVVDGAADQFVDEPVLQPRSRALEQHPAGDRLPDRVLQAAVVGGPRAPQQGKLLPPAEHRADGQEATGRGGQPCQALTDDLSNAVWGVEVG